MATPKTTPVFKRTNISWFEKGLSLCILLLLAGVGYAVFDKGQHFDPNLFSPDPMALENTREAIVGKAGTLRNQADLRAYEGSPNNVPAQSANELSLMVGGLTPGGATERYVEDTLYEKINGRAPAYFEFNFQELTTRSFILDTVPGQFIDVYLFRMDSPLNAFGIFSLENDRSGQAVDFAPDGYRSQMGYFFRKGSVYAQVLASDTAPAVMKAAGEVAQALAESLAPDNRGMEARGLLPQAGLLPGSVSYIQQNAYGQALLKNVFEGKYQQQGVELPYFAMKAKTPEEAEAAWKDLQAFYQRFGSIAETWDIEQGGETVHLFAGESFDQWSVIYRSGRNVAGVMNADESEAARTFITGLLEVETPNYE